MHKNNLTVPVRVLLSNMLFAGVFLISGCSGQADQDAKADTAVSTKTTLPEENNILLMPHFNGSKWGYIDISGKLMLPAVYDDATGFSEDLAAVKKDGRWQFIDKKGNSLAIPQVDSCTPFYNGMAAVKKGSSWGFIDKTGKLLIACQYNNVRLFSEGKAAVYENGWQFIDKTGKRLFNVSCTDILANGFYGGTCIIQRNNKIVIIDSTGKETDLTDPLLFHEGLAAKKGSSGNKGYVDSSGQFKISAQYAIAGDFSEGLAPVAKAGKPFGYINQAGELKIKPAYLYAGRFVNGLAPVQDYKSMLWGFIDKTGNWVISPVYSMALQFAGNYAPVQRKDEQWTLTDTAGHEPAAIGKYDDIAYVYSNSGLLSVLAKDASSQRAGKDIPIALLVTDSTLNHIFWARTAEGWFLINEKGEKVVTAYNQAQKYRTSFN